ncbi:MAG TPA: hypothetical protein VEL31_16225 [Ktedonobacteraceae bacterium]|nr:hypothetical protein [Ktedonobacteraceae bacterium]
MREIYVYADKIGLIGIYPTEFQPRAGEIIELHLDLIKEIEDGSGKVLQFRIAGIIHRAFNTIEGERIGGILDAMPENRTDWRRPAQLIATVEPFDAAAETYLEEIWEEKRGKRRQRDMGVSAFPLLGQQT